MSDNAMWSIMACALFFMIAAIVITVVCTDVYRDCKYIENGYTRKTLVGYDWPQWVKEPQK